MPELKLPVFFTLIVPEFEKTVPPLKMPMLSRPVFSMFTVPELEKVPELTTPLLKVPTVLCISNVAPLSTWRIASVPIVTPPDPYTSSVAPDGISKMFPELIV